jgi:hypothetical protein
MSFLSKLTCGCIRDTKPTEQARRPKEHANKDIVSVPSHRDPERQSAADILSSANNLVTAFNETVATGEIRPSPQELGATTENFLKAYDAARAVERTHLVAGSASPHYAGPSKLGRPPQLDSPAGNALELLCSGLHPESPSLSRTSSRSL